MARALILGKNLSNVLKKKYKNITYLGRLNQHENFFNVEDEISTAKAFKDIDIVIHCAGKTHVMSNEISISHELFQRSNVDLTEKLMNLSIKNRIKRFIFISSLKVNGEVSSLSKPFTCFDEPNPEDDYAKSKLLAEESIKKLSKNNAIETVIIRPPLIYGNGAKGNFRTLFNMVSRRIPLPFSNLKNKRSMVYIENLIDLICVCIENPKAAGQTFLASDDRDMSTPEMIEHIGASTGIRPIMFPISKSLLSFFGKLVGKSSQVQKLTGTLQANIVHTKDTLDWHPPYSIDEAFKGTAKGKD